MQTEVKKHSKFSASGASRWLNCPGSIALSEKAPPQKDSPYAMEGTKAHEVLELLLTGQGKKAAKSSEEMFRHANAAEKIIRARQKEDKGELIAETKVSLEFVHPGLFGTVDAAIVDEFGRLTVIDYKYGAGIPVDPDENPQLLYYALGLAHKYHYNFSTVSLMVIQPRAEHREGPVREWNLGIDHLVRWTDAFADGVKAALKPNAPQKAGAWCKFCPASSICPEISKKALETAASDFADCPSKSGVEIVLPETLDTQSLGKALDAIEHVETWIGSVKEQAFNALNRGEAVTGWKLVPKRSIRKWNDATKLLPIAKKKFGDKAFKTEILSPAQMEKVAGLEWVSKFSSSVSSGLTMAKESDKRQGTTSAALDFQNE